MAINDIRGAVEKILKDLNGAVQARGMYGEKHRLTKEGLDRFCMTLGEALSSQNREITIGVIGGEIAFEKTPFYNLSQTMEGLISRMKEKGLEKITFLKGIEKREAERLIDILSMKTQDIESQGGIERVMGSSGFRNITFGRIAPGGASEGSCDPYKSARDNYEEGADFLRKALDDICADRGVDMETARLFVNKVIANLSQNRYPLLILASLKRRDEYTFVHAINVAIFTLAQAGAIGLDQGLFSDIGVAALLHDTGKLAVMGEILRKKEKLNEEELEKIRSHPLDGAKILLATPEIPLVASIAAFEHHIRYDMKGYPARLYGKKLNLASMMITIADVYDALRSQRAYHEYIPPEKTYEEMVKLSGENFHPGLLENFFTIVGVYSPGTLVELDDKAVGLVVKENARDIRRPQVEILYNTGGEKEEAPYIIDLSEKDEKGQNYRWAVAKSIAPSDKYEIPQKYR